MTPTLHKEAEINSTLVTPEMISVKSKRRLDGSYETNTLVTKSGPEIFVLRTEKLVRTQKSMFASTTPIDSKPKISYPFGRAKLLVTYPFGKSRRDDNVRRARTRVKRLVLSNWPLTPSHAFQNPCFVTLTYPDSPYAKIQNRLRHIEDIQQFFRKLRSRFDTPDLRYIAVMELTKKQNVHWHIIVFGLPKYSHPYSVLDLWLQVVPEATINNQDIKRVPWGSGNAKAQAKKLSGYLTKYITKAFEENFFSFNKLYLPSKGLTQPIKKIKPSDVSAVLEQAVSDCYYKTHQSDTFYLPWFDTWAYYEIWET